MATSSNSVPIPCQFEPAQTTAASLMEIARLSYQAMLQERAQQTSKLRRDQARQLWEHRRRVRRLSQQSARRNSQAELLAHISKLEQHYHRELRAAEHDLLELVRDLTAEILQDHFENQPASIGQRIHTALNQLIDQRHVIARVSSKDALSLSASSDCPLPSEYIEIDPSLEPGDVILATKAGVIELRWRKQLTAIIGRLHSTLTQSIDCRRTA